MKIYNTLTRTVEQFTPNEDNTVRMYTCGPTVYHYAHIGNLRTYIFEDILENKLKKIIFIVGLIIIILASIIFICNLFKIDLPFTGYKGMEHIGTINMGEK